MKLLKIRERKIMDLKYCPECGNPLKPEDMKFCPNCKTLIETEPRYQPKTNIKAKKRVWRNSSWILLLIGSVIGIMSIFIPAGSFHLANLLSWDMWMFGYNIFFESGVGTDIFWTGNSDFFAFSIGSTVFVVIGNVMAILGVITLLRKKDYAYLLAGAGAVILTGSTLFYLISYEVYSWIFFGDTFWGVLYPWFGVYGQFIAAAFMLPAFFLARRASQYSDPLEKEDHQEKMYNMLKTIIENKILPESTKSRLLNELEVISLRLKGVAKLQEKIMVLNPENQSRINLDDPISYFQQALILSSSSQQNISKIDLQLVEQINEEQEKIKALRYLREISYHTTVLLGEIVKIFK
ncbi:MAG: zinc ribbon domain-containing protein [Candidatus Lokiarchaeota archaeon]|nr:zinc ribbon domain-containing protein [Candidatus Lokiarchaeota archaeon]